MECSKRWSMPRYWISRLLIIPAGMVFINTFSDRHGAPDTAILKRIINTENGVNKNDKNC